MDYSVYHHFQQYFSYIVAVSFIDGENRSTQKKTTDLSQVSNKLLTHNFVSSTPHLSRIQTHSVRGDRPYFAHVIVTQTTIRQPLILSGLDYFL